MALKSRNSSVSRLEILVSYEVDGEIREEFIRNQEKIQQKLEDKRRREIESRTKAREERAAKVA